MQHLLPVYRPCLLGHSPSNVVALCPVIAPELLTASASLLQLPLMYAFPLKHALPDPMVYCAAGI